MKIKSNTTHIVFSGGGTGGHLFPGLAVAQRLVETIPHIRITFSGVGKTFERKYVARAGFDYLCLPARPLPTGAREAVTFLVENMAGYIAAKQFLREETVAAVVGLGGYASVPMARAAARHHVPLVLLEQNAVAGKATRWLARRASLVCTSFPETLGLRCRCPVRVTGNPVRKGEKRGDRGEGREKKEEGIKDANLVRGVGGSQPTLLIPNSQSLIPEIPSRLLVLGGSGGARSLNENVPRALYKIRGQLAGWRIIHQSGDTDVEATRTLYAKFDLPAVVVPFLGNMPAVLSKTDLAVCRAGGTTLAELAAWGVPAVLLPYPHAADDHQAANAGHFAAGGGCVTIDQRLLPGRLDDQLADILCFLLANDPLRQRMSAAMSALARPNAADDAAELIWSIASSRSHWAEPASA
jgi:UDP-N-acetylglucosamine--N-acetylmuramyl-(pentapeptide) pyrophosphoryl-undecaprenol N-acetylglucosamine transferase